MTILQYFGSSVLVVIVALLIVDLIHVKRLTAKELLGRIILFIFVMLALLRT
jgi:hypothetical protein